MTTETKDWKTGIAKAAEALVKEYGFTREALFGENGVALELHKAIAEKTLEGEMTLSFGVCAWRKARRGGKLPQRVQPKNGHRQREENGDLSTARPARKLSTLTNRKRAKAL